MRYDHAERLKADEIHQRFTDEKHPAAPVSPEWGPNPFCGASEHSDECPRGCVYDDDPTQCIDGAGNAWPEHDESGYGECRRCGAELEVTE